MLVRKELCWKPMRISCNKLLIEQWTLYTTKRPPQKFSPAKNTQARAAIIKALGCSSLRPSSPSTYHLSLHLTHPSPLPLNCHSLSPSPPLSPLPPPVPPLPLPLSSSRLVEPMRMSSLTVNLVPDNILNRPTDLHSEIFVVHNNVYTVLRCPCLPPSPFMSPSCLFLSLPLFPSLPPSIPTSPSP